MPKRRVNLLLTIFFTILIISCTTNNNPIDNITMTSDLVWLGEVEAERMVKIKTELNFSDSIDSAYEVFKIVLEKKGKIKYIDEKEGVIRANYTNSFSKDNPKINLQLTPLTNSFVKVFIEIICIDDPLTPTKKKEKILNDFCNDLDLVLLEREENLTLETNNYVNFIINTTSNDADERYDNIYKILNDLNQILRSKGNMNSHYYETFMKTNNLLTMDLIKITEDNENDNAIFGGAEFEVNWDTGNNVIKVGHNLIDLYSTHPSLVYSILIHEMKHAVDYHFDKEAFRNQEIDPYEKIMYEMDASFVEAEFITDIVINNYSITEFEKLVYESNIEDGLRMFSILALQCDIQIVYGLYDAREEYHQNGDKRVLDENLGDIGTQILDYFRQNSSDEEFNYYSNISLSTFYTYSKILFMQIEGSRDEIKTWDYIFQEYPSFSKSFLAIQDLVLENSDYVEETNKEIQESFEESLNL